MTAAARPFGVTVIVVLLLVPSFAAVGAGALALVEAFQRGGAIEPLPDPSTLRLLATAAGLVAFGVAVLVVAIGLVRLQRWAWVLTMLYVGFSLADGLWRYFFLGERPYVDMLLDVIAVFYLNQRDVQRAFGQGGGHNPRRDAPVRHAR